MKRNKIRTIVCAAATLTLLFAGAIQASAEDVEFQGSQIPENGWYEENGKFYWYENGVRQGTEGRGKEIYDPASDAWYWLDAVQGGAKAVNKDVYQESASAYPDRPDGTGKWCRYDENGHMVKGWQTTANGATYYFEQQTGAMAKGFVVIDGKKCGFDVTTGAGINGWSSLDGKDYWYEKAVRQGTEGRGKEIYDPSSDAWYWLDAIQGGIKAVSKDVYQESEAGQWADRPDGTGKWVRYDENGHMIKGWQTTWQGRYYFDPVYGTMAKGEGWIDGQLCYFDPASGIGADRKWVSLNGGEYWYENAVRQGYRPEDPSYRGKEVYDPSSDAWYWLDNVDAGKKAVSKDVYQESAAGQWAENPDGTGKWVRYDANGHMVKGWQTTENGTYYFDLNYGTMAKGNVWIDGKQYSFDPATGVLQNG